MSGKLCLLCTGLGKRFKQNTDAENDRLQTGFEVNTDTEGNPPSQMYYGKDHTVAIDLRTLFNVDVTDDMVCRALFKGLPDNAEHSFLQLKVTPPFSTGSLHDLVIEVINRHETLM